MSGVDHDALTKAILSRRSLEKRGGREKLLACIGRKDDNEQGGMEKVGSYAIAKGNEGSANEA